jgi:hypothetical protein
MGVTLVAPLRMTEDLAGRQVWSYEEAGVLKDWTGWTGTWRIAHKDAGDLADGTVTLNAYGTITMTWTADETAAMAEYAPRRGFVLPGVTLEMEVTDTTDTRLFQAAVAWEARA